MAKTLISRGGLSHLNKKDSINKDEKETISINNNVIDKKNLTKLHPRSFRLSLEDQDLLRELTKNLNQEIKMNVTDTTVIKALIRLAHKTEVEKLISSIKETLI